MRLLVTGVSGMLGHSLTRLAARDHAVSGSYGSFPVSMPGARTFAMDLTDEGQLRRWVRELEPQAIIHTAALTNVDECERDLHRAKRINAGVTRRLADLAGEVRARFVYISTDYVFDGARGDYREADPPSPVNAYGESKLMGEVAAREASPDALIIRTSIFGFNIQPKTGVVEYVMNALKKRQTITRYLDQFSTPIYTADLSRLILELLDRGATGLFHAGGGEKISRYRFARQVADTWSLPGKLIRPVPFEQLAGAARRPKDSSLCGEKLSASLGSALPKVIEGMERLKKDMRGYHRAGAAR